jgi:hypothetical protein
MKKSIVSVKGTSRVKTAYIAFSMMVENLSVATVGQLPEYEYGSAQGAAGDQEC